jgi:tetratricopeptide (TPR) repeat protein
MRKIFYLLKLSLTAILITGYQPNAISNIDSLLLVLQEEQDEFTRCDVLEEIYTYFYENDDLRKAEIYAVQAISLARSIGYRSKLAQSLSYLAYILESESEYDMALTSYNEALAISKEVGDSHLTSKLYGYIGYIHYINSNYTLSRQFINRALNLSEQINDSASISMAYNTLAMIYEAYEEYNLALDYYNRSINIDYRINDSLGVATGLNNIGEVYKHKGEHEIALEYYHRAKEIYEKYNNLSGISTTLHNIAVVYQMMGEYDKALDFHWKTLDLVKRLNDQSGILLTHYNLAKLYMEIGDYAYGKNHMYLAYERSEEIGVLNDKILISELMYDFYKKHDNLEKAMEHLENMVKYREIVNKEGQRKEVLTLGVQYEYEKKSLQDSIRFESVIQQQNIILEEERKQKAILYTGLALGLALLLIIISRLRIIKNQNKVIEAQKTLVEEKNKEVIDSIAYAKNLQNAILPPKSLIDERLTPYLGQNSFILYMPKDIVAGDFYWMEVNRISVTEDEERKDIFFAVGDCTGHGVPGAMVSIVCSNALTRVVKEFPSISPAEVLDNVSKIVEDTFNSESSENGDVQDGMDICLCKINYHSNLEAEYSNMAEGEEIGTVDYAGANNPLWIIRKKDVAPRIIDPDFKIKGFDDYELVELLPDKQPVGKFAYRKPFVGKSCPIYKGDRLYLFSDGFYDQFGGDVIKKGGKKFKTSNFKKLLLENQSPGIIEQRDIIVKYFYEWKGELEQLDDVCVVGIQV